MEIIKTIGIGDRRLKQDQRKRTPRGSEDFEIVFEKACKEIKENGNVYTDKR